MKENHDHPGVYIPPPLFYVACFFLAVFIQKIEPIDRSFFLSGLSKVIGATILLIGMFFHLPSIRQFFKTKNTLIPIKPANSLQTTGIYSISSFFVTQRTREIGVRMSLGATRPAILRMVLSQSYAMTGIGLLIGVPVAILLTIGMSSALYNIVSVRPIVFILFIAVLGAAAGIAGYIPAYRAARVDPVVALRQE